MPREPQADGRIIWGTGQALEKPETDPVRGRLFNGSYSGYLVPTNAHIPEADVEFTGDFEHEPSLLGTKALGELTAASAAPAIANGVYHATGTRCGTCLAP